MRWAFVSYRPNNEWLFRVGRLRPPVLINTQNAEVGVTYDQTRLPVEVYSLSPVYDIDGGAFTKTLILAGSEISLDGYLGKSKLRQRTPFQRDAAQTFVSDKYFPENVSFMGLVLTQSVGSLKLRGGVHRAVIRPDKGRQFVQDPSPQSIPAPPPFGGTLYVPGPVNDRIAVNAFTAGADWQSDGWRISGEYGRRIAIGTKMGPGSDSAYVTIARDLGRWTPYATYSRILSTAPERNYYQTLNATPVPLGAQGPPLFLPASFHGIFADAIFLYDQYSGMIGTSYDISINSKLKFELMHSHIGVRSAMVDGDVRHKSFNVLSISYGFVF